MSIEALLAVARGDAPADLVLRNGKLVNVFLGEIEDADVAVSGGRVAGIGRGYRGHSELDLRGAFVVPGLIDAHVHIESSLATPAAFAAAVLAGGVTTVVADPHEIANVAGASGVTYMASASRTLPLRVILQAPSCVPASSLATSGAALDAAALSQLRSAGVVHGLGEVMSFPGVVAGDPEVLAKLAAFADRPRDGHAPGLGGKALCAYVAAGPGSDHECTRLAEAAEQLARGVTIFIREASGARNLGELLPLVNARTERRVCLCTDDRHPAQLLAEGSVDGMVRTAVAAGLDPVTAIRLVTLNPAEWFGLRDRGAIAPGRLADLVVVDDLEDFVARQVFVGGQLVAEGGRLVDPARSHPDTPPPAVAGSVRVHWDAIDFRIPARGGRVRVIGVVPGQVLTRHLVVEARLEAGCAVADPDGDLAKLAVIERHRATGRVGLGFAQGLGLARGALATTVAHDHHNLLVAGMDDASMLCAARAVARMGGGMVAAVGDTVLAELALPVGGLMSELTLEEIGAAHRDLIRACRSLGSSLDDPFMATSFLGLEVIPELKLTDRGLVDVGRFEIVDLFPA